MYTLFRMQISHSFGSLGPVQNSFCQPNLVLLGLEMFLQVATRTELHHDEDRRMITDHTIELDDVFVAKNERSNIFLFQNTRQIECFL